MTLLFDASAVINLIMKGSRRALPSTRNGCVLDLTEYEIGNAAWQLCAVEKKLTGQEAAGLLRTASAFLEQLRRVRLDELDPDSILAIAIAEGSTFYDASYVEAATFSRMTLVTDDAELREVARKRVPVQRSTDV